VLTISFDSFIILFSIFHCLPKQPTYKFAHYYFLFVLSEEDVEDPEEIESKSGRQKFVWLERNFHFVYGFCFRSSFFLISLMVSILFFGPPPFVPLVLLFFLIDL